MVRPSISPLNKGKETSMDLLEDIDDRIRRLCREIAEESDADKVNELSVQLRHILRVQHNTTRLRLQNIAMRYGSQMRSAEAPSSPPTESGSRIMALLTFLGLPSKKAA